jgi:hypothetical protein
MDCVQNIIIVVLATTLVVCPATIWGYNQLKKKGYIKG